jgi:hypothetical protein
LAAVVVDEVRVAVVGGDLAFLRRQGYRASGKPSFIGNVG